MKYFTFLAVSALMFTWMACGHGRPLDESGTTGTIQPAGPANSTTQPQTIPVNLSSQTTPSTTVIPSGTTGTPVAGLNPAHGQPGHRCDIAVGAPLNSKPAQPTTTPAATTAPATTPFTISADKPSQPAATTAVAPGMNPAHGQPGHRCDIAVGAPLNSKPAQQPAINQTSPINISADQAAKPVATTAVGPGMNPAHGQPGHRCDIAVGAPLSTPINPNYTPPVASKEILPKVIPIKALPDSTGKNR